MVVNKAVGSEGVVNEGVVNEGVVNEGVVVMHGYCKWWTRCCW